MPSSRTDSGQDAEQRFGHALAVWGMGILDHDLVGGGIYCSPEMRALYGWPESLTPTFDTFIDHTHAEDREQLLTAIALAQDPAGDGRFELEYRIVRPDGVLRWISGRSQTYFEGDGLARRAVRVIGSAIDITASHAAADLLREREASLRRSERLARIGYFTLDGQGNTLTSSEGNNRIWGLPADVCPTIDDFRARVSPEDAPKFREAWEIVIAPGRGRAEFEFTFRRPDGTDVIARSLMEFGRDPLTNSVRIFGTNIDITAQKRAEAALAVSAERLRQAVRLGRLGIFDHDHSTDTSYWSPEQRAIWGLGPDDEPLVTAAGLVHVADRLGFDAAIAAAHNTHGDGAFDIEHRIVTPAGETRWIHTRAQTYFDGEGDQRRRVRTVGATADITSRKLVERDLVIKQDAIASAVTGILISDLDARITYLNAAWLRIYGFDDPAEVIGTTPLDYTDPEDHDAVRRALELGDYWIGKISSKRRDGSTFVGELAVSRVRDASGAPVAYLGSILDSTERQMAQTALERSEALRRSVFDASLDAILVGRQQRMVLVNPATAAMFGYDSTEEMEGLPFSLTVAPSELDRVLRINTARELGELAPSFYETRLRRKDGTEFDAEVSASSYTIDSTTYPVAVVRDVTARRASVRALRESADHLSAVFNSTSDGQLLYRVEDDGRLFIVSANKTFQEIRHRHFPDAPPQIEGLYRDEMLAAQGLSPEVIEAEMPIHQQVIASRQMRSYEFEVPLPNGDTSVLEARIAPVLDEDGLCTHLLWSGRDINERRKAQEAVTQMNALLEQRVAERTEQLEAANRELEAFAYSVSHDLRAPARAVDGYAGMLIEDHAPRLDQEGLRLCRVVRSEAKRMGRLIDDLLMLSRLGRTAMQSAPVDMMELAREVFDHLMKDADPSRVVFRLDGLPAAIGDRSLLRQVWINLIGNALKFSARMPSSVIDVEGRRESQEVVYTVRDNGAGFDMAYQQKLFGVFQRLHSDHEFEGTGVGLAIVQRVVQRHGGRVWADAAIGRGASFTFALPIEELSA